MFKLLFAFDFWLFKRHTRFAHWFERETGRTNYFLAFCTLASTPVCALFAGAILTREHPLGFVLVGFGCVLGVLMHRYLRMFWVMDMKARNNLPLLRTFSHVGGRYIRLLCLMLFLATAVSALQHPVFVWLMLMATFVVMSDYFMSVKRPPPLKRDERVPGDAKFAL